MKNLRSYNCFDLVQIDVMKGEQLSGYLDWDVMVSDILFSGVIW